VRLVKSGKNAVEVTGCWWHDGHLCEVAQIVSWVKEGGAAASTSYGGCKCWSWTCTCRVSSGHYAVLSRIIEISIK